MCLTHDDRCCPLSAHADSSRYHVMLSGTVRRHLLPRHSVFSDVFVRDESNNGRGVAVSKFEPAFVAELGNLGALPALLFALRWL